MLHKRTCTCTHGCHSFKHNAFCWTRTLCTCSHIVTMPQKHSYSTHSATSILFTLCLCVFVCLVCELFFVCVSVHLWTAPTKDSPWFWYTFHELGHVSTGKVEKTKYKLLIQSYHLAGPTLSTLKCWIGAAGFCLRHCQGYVGTIR